MGLKFVSITVFFFAAISSFNARGQLFKFEFNGTGICPTQDNQPEIAPSPNLTVSSLTRVGTNLNCVAMTDGFSTSGFSGPNIDLLDNYIELTMTVASGYYLNVSSIFFMVSRSGSTAPTYGRVAHDGSGSFASYNDFQIQTTNNPINWTSFSPFSSSDGGTVKIRFYAYNPAISTPGTGGLRLDKINVFGSITTSPLSSLWVQQPGDNIVSTNTGSVGIGTSSPHSDSKLDVNGNIFTNGKLLIGTNNISTVSNYSLAVNGDAIFNKIKIKSYATWPDYVFDETYELPKLEYIKDFISKYKHLPGVPSASEVLANGIDITETQEILLKKIEELTLYVLELNDRLTKIESKGKKKTSKR